MRRLHLLSTALVLAVATACSGDTGPDDGEAEAKKTAPAKEAPAKAQDATQKADPAGAEAAGEAKSAPEPTPLPEGAPPALTDPSLAAETAPASYTCRFDTTKGTFAVKVTREWAPNGADRFYNLCKVGYFHEARFFRNVAGFMVQFGMSAYPEATKVWQKATIKDDPVVQSNKPLYVTFAKTNRPDSRSTQVFINHKDNANLDAMGFAPFGQIVEGADVVKSLYTGYGEGAPRGRGPRQDILAAYGEVYLAAEFPKLDKITKTTLVE